MHAYADINSVHDASGSHQRRCCQAAAASDQATDLTQLFKDALETPKQLTDNLPNVPKPKLDTEKLPSPTAPTEGAHMSPYAIMHCVCAGKACNASSWCTHA